MCPAAAPAAAPGIFYVIYGNTQGLPGDLSNFQVGAGRTGGLERREGVATPCACLLGPPPCVSLTFCALP